MSYEDGEMIDEGETPHMSKYLKTQQIGLYNYILGVWLGTTQTLIKVQYLQAKLSLINRAGATASWDTWASRQKLILVVKN